jgi:hypothetical protein
MKSMATDAEAQHQPHRLRTLFQILKRSLKRAIERRITQRETLNLSFRETSD